MSGFDRAHVFGLRSEGQSRIFPIMLYRLTATRKFARNIFANFLAKSVGLAMSLVLVPLAVGGLGPSDYALYAATMSATLIFSYADLGLGLALVNKVADKSNSDADHRDAISRIWTYLCCIGFVLTFVPFCAALYFLQLGAPQWALGAFCAGLVGIGIPSSLSSKALFGQGEQQLAVALDVAGRLFALLSVYLCWHQKLGLLFYLAATIGPPILVNWVFTIWYFWGRKDAIRPVFYGKMPVSLIADDLRAGLAFTMLQIAVYAEYGIDNVLISTYGGAADVVRYDLISRLFNYIPAFSGLVTFPLWPALRTAFTSGDARTANLLFRATTAFVLLASLILGAIFFSLHQPIIKVWTGIVVPPDALLVACIAAFSVATSVVAVQTAALNAAGFLRAQIIFLIWSCPILLAAKVAGLAAGYLFIVPASTLLLFVIKLVVFRRALTEAWSS